MNTRPQPKQTLLYLAYLISQIGNWAFRIGIIIGLLQSSLSALGLGVAIIFAPIIIGSLVISPLADRVDRLGLMIGIDLLRAATMFPLFLLQKPDTGLTYAVILVLSLSQPAFMSAQLSYLRSVTSREDMVTAVRNISNVDWITYILGMASGAMLSASFSLAGIALLNAMSFIFSAALLWILKASKSPRTAFPPDRPGKPRLDQPASGRPYHGYLISILLLNLGAGIINVYPAIRTTSEQPAAHSALSTIVIMNGLFGLFGALAVKPLYQRFGAATAMAVSALSVALFLLLMATNNDIGLAAISSSLMLCMGQIFAVSAQTHLITETESQTAGKLSGLFQCCTYGGISLNGILFSVFAERLEFGLIVKLCALCAFVAFLISIAVSARQTMRVEHAQPDIRGPHDKDQPAKSRPSDIGSR